MAKTELPPEVVSSVKQAFMRDEPKTQIAATHEIHRHTVTKLIERHGWEAEKKAIQARASEKYIEKKSDLISQAEDEVNENHSFFLSTLGGEFRELLEQDSFDGEQMKELNQKMNFASNLIRLEREVHGLDKKSNLPPLDIPSKINISVFSPDGSTTIMAGSHITDEQDADLVEMLPNQNEAHFGEDDDTVLFIESDDDDDDLSVEPEKGPFSLDM